MNYQYLVRDRYAATIALLLMAFIASPLVLFASRPFSYVSLSGALAFSCLCVGGAWIQWTWHSASTIPSIIQRPGLMK